MFSLRISGIIAGAAFLLSFFLGVVSRSTMPLLLVKPVIFAVLFFVISGLANILIYRFLPELLEGGGPVKNSELLSGSRINIMEEDSGVSPEGDSAVSNGVFVGARPNDSDHDLGNISDLAGRLTASQATDEKLAGEGVSSGMDQNTENGYTEMGGLVDFSGIGKDSGFAFAPIPVPPPSAGSKAEESPSVPGEPRRKGTEAAAIFDSGDALPDLDSMAGAFVLNSSNEERETIDQLISAPPKKSSSGKGQAWAGDFNAKEIAEGLRTVLIKDKEG